MNNNNFANFVSSTGRHGIKDAEGQNLILNDIFVSVDMKVIRTKGTTVKIGLLH